ncbi:MAG: hypothetical protein KDA57_06830 [Planctomycetales bacterium]|nr:hypothetical protein [Planctomycetales bacterium]
MLRLVCAIAGGVLVSIVTCHLAANAETSELWGQAGESWKSDGRLPDYSYAGYLRGESELPDRPAEANVKDFGAVGDGKTDDTAAFIRAINEARGKVLAIPRGRYLITDILEIRDSSTVLRGEGADQTVIFAPKPLEMIRSNMGATTGGRPTSNYSWSGGIIWAKGQWDKNLLAVATNPARRGESSLTVDKPDAFKIGDEVRLVIQDDSELSLANHLYAGDPGDTAKLKGALETWIARITRIDSEIGRLDFDRQLRTDVRPEWKPTLYAAHSTVEEVGIEQLAFEFPITPYSGHFTELGFNAIAYGNVRNGWIRDVEIRHADSGIFLGGANSTVTGVVWLSGRPRDTSRNSTGHHGITLGGTDLLLSDFDFRTKFIHDITVTRGSAGNVVRAGRGEDLTFDHHKYANHSNLYTNLDAGEATNIFRSGGGAALGRHCGAWTTWWNIRTASPVDFPAGWATEVINLVGIRSEKPSLTDWEGRWFEAVKPAQLVPQDLYKSQLTRRLDANR